MDPKLTMLYLLFGAIIGLSRLGRKNCTKMKSEFDGQRWRDIVLDGINRKRCVSSSYGPYV
jgi:hypothetical protein